MFARYVNFGRKHCAVRVSSSSWISGLEPCATQSGCIATTRSSADLFQRGPASKRQAPIRAIPVPSPTRVDRLRRRFVKSAMELARAEPFEHQRKTIAARTRSMRRRKWFLRTLAPCRLPLRVPSQSSAHGSQQNEPRPPPGAQCYDQATLAS